MDLIIHLINSGFTGSSLVTLLLGAMIGWSVPQPAWANTLTKMICKKFNLSRFRMEGHKHSDEHENVDHSQQINIDLGELNHNVDNRK